MNVWNSTAFRIGFLSAIIGVIASVLISIYFNNQQRDLIKEYLQHEFDINASVAASVIEDAIIKEDFEMLNQIIPNIAQHNGFVYISIIENETVFSCYPEAYSEIAITYNENLIYSESPVKSSLLDGKIVIAASKESNQKFLSEINRPFVYLVIVSVISALLLFIISLILITQPIFKAVGIAAELGNHNYNVDINLLKGKSEVIILNNSLHQLKENLIILQNENDKYKTDLETKISEITNEIKSKNIELSLLNKNLEQKVIEKTQKNIEMSNSLISQEKLVLIGEVSSGIAHDLNTPLGSIKASNDNLLDLIKNLNSNSQNLSNEEVLIVDSILNMSPPLDPFLKKNKIREESKSIEKYLDDRGVKSLQLAFDLASVGIKSENKDFINKIIALPDPRRLLVLINQYVLIINFITGIKEAVNKSSMVVSSLNRFIRNDINREIKEINLKSSIGVLETLFRYRLKNDVIFLIQIDKEHSVRGVETELFQIWTNLLKNALDSFDELDKKKERVKKIRVFTEKTDDFVFIHFENNGPKIPENIQDKIMKKYFTTKKQKGTGLGLSLVKKIVEEHYGKFSFYSSNEKTIFTISLPS